MLDGIELSKIIDALQLEGIQIRVEGTRLRYSCNGTVLPEKLRSVIAENRECLLHHLKDQQVDIQNRAAAGAGHFYGVMDVSAAQESLWFIKQSRPNDVSYNIPVVLYLDGQIDNAILQTAIDHLINRHSLLRSSFDEFNGEVKRLEFNRYSQEIAVQKISPEDLPQKISTAVSHNFDLTRLPLWHMSVFEFGRFQYAVVINFHHIIADGRSVAIFCEELSHIYNSFIQGKSPELPTIVRQYNDFVLLRNQDRYQKRIVKQQDYWKSAMQGAPEKLEFPSVFNRPPATRHIGDSFEFCLPEHAIRLAESSCKQLGITLFTGLFAIFKMLLFRYSGQTDLLVGVPVANRVEPGSHSAFGMYSNTVVIRTFIDPGKTLAELARELKISMFSALANQEYPISNLVSETGFKRSQSYSPLFQVVFSYQDEPCEYFSLKGSDLVKIERPIKSSKFDLCVNLRRKSDGINGVLEFNAELFDKSYCESIIDHYLLLLYQGFSNPNKKICQMPMLSTMEENLFDRTLFYKSGAERQEPLTLMDLFEKSVRDYPDKPAIIFEHRVISYRVLNQKANQLAHYLVALGIKRNSFVGVCVNRSVNMVVSLLAVLKSGAAYVPLDPDYPQSRLDYMLQDSAITFLIAETNVKHQLCFDVKHAILLDSMGDQLDKMPVSAPEILREPTDLAYLIYTSGSTGNPKGVMIEQGSLVNFLRSMAKAPGLSSEDILCAITAISFDIHVLELYLPLIVGATTVVASRKISRDPETLKGLLSEQKVTVIQGTPTTFKSLLLSNWQPERSLKILCGGEYLPPDLHSALTSINNVELWNLYGPTEATVWTSVEKRSFNGHNATIGFPIDNTQLYILDSWGNRLPAMVPGELYIGGLGLARGYFNKQELTGEKFITNPFYNELEPSSSQRLYKTGDLCRYLSDGNIQFLGRIDNQVKIRGFRIELAEIESALLQHEFVRDAVVIAKTDERNDKQLVAFITSVSANRIPDDNLYRHLSKTLPDFMIPSLFMYLDNLPLTPNNKIDKKALEAISLTSVFPEQAESYEALTATELEIYPIWCGLLELDNLSKKSNFFYCGGHSILAIKLVSQINKHFRLSITLEDFLCKPTMAGLAEKISALTFLKESEASRYNDNNVSSIEIII